MLHLLAQTAYDYSTYNYDTQSSGAGIPPALIVLYVALAALMLVSLWKIYQKAGKPGWAAIVPFYNSWVLLQIAGKPTWWFFLMFVPFVNLVVSVLVYIELAKAFGKGGGFAALMIFLPFIAFPMLAFGKAEYHAPAGASGGTPSQPSSTPPATPSAPADPTPTPTPPASQPPTA